MLRPVLGTQLSASDTKSNISASTYKSVFCSNCGSQLSSGTEKFCPNCGQGLSKGGRREEENRGGINISGTQGDVMGVGVSGSGNIVGKNIDVEDIRNVDSYSTKPEKYDKLVIERYPYARFPDKIVLGDIIPLEIIINAVKPQSYHKAQTSIELTTSHAEAEIPVVVTLEWTNGFELKGEQYYATIYVPVVPEDSKPVIFNFMAKEEGAQIIVIRFYQQQTYVGQIQINSQVVHSGAELQVKSAISPPQTRGWTSNKLLEKTLQGPDITINIQERKVSPDFEYGVLISSPEFPIKEMGPIKFSFNPETKFHRIFEDIENINLGSIFHLI